MLLGQLVYSIYIFKEIINMLYIKVELYLGTDDGTESGGVLLPKIGVIVQETTLSKSPKRRAEWGRVIASPARRDVWGTFKKCQAFF